MKEDVFYFWLRIVEGTDLHRGLLTIGRIDPEWLAAMFSALTFSACQDRNSDEPLNLASLIKFALLREDPLGQYFDPAHLNASLEAIQLPFSSIGVTIATILPVNMGHPLCKQVSQWYVWYGIKSKQTEPF